MKDEMVKSCSRHRGENKGKGKGNSKVVPVFFLN